MRDVTRDAALAGLCGGIFLAVLLASDATATLLDPVVVAAGVGVALAVEVAFLVDSPVVEAWNQRWVPTAAAAMLVVGAAGSVVLVGPAVVAAACWGLLTYFAVLGIALSGHWPVEANTTDR